VDFFNKNIELPVQTIFIYSRWRWGMEYAMSVDVRNGTLEGIYGTATHGTFLVPTRFGIKTPLDG
jgi:hypothetical protein